MDDLEIMELIAQGDERGMPELQKRYGALVRYVAAPILGSGAAVSARGSRPSRETRL